MRLELELGEAKDAGIPRGLGLKNLFASLPALRELVLEGCPRVARVILQGNCNLPLLDELRLLRAFDTGSHPLDPQTYAGLSSYPKLHSLKLDFHPSPPRIPNYSSAKKLAPLHLEAITSLALRGHFPYILAAPLFAILPNISRLHFVDTFFDPDTSSIPTLTTFS